MPSNEKIVRDELLLPNIVLFNQLFVEAQRINGHNKDYEVKTRLPNLEATSKPGNFFIGMCCNYFLKVL